MVNGFKDKVELFTEHLDMAFIPNEAKNIEEEINNPTYENVKRIASNFPKEIENTRNQQISSKNVLGYVLITDKVLKIYLVKSFKRSLL